MKVNKPDFITSRTVDKQQNAKKKRMIFWIIKYGFVFPIPQGKSLNCWFSAGPYSSRVLFCRHPILYVSSPLVSIKGPYSSTATDWETLTMLSASFAFPAPTLPSSIFLSKSSKIKGRNENTPFSLFFPSIQVHSSWLKFIFMLIRGTSFRLSLTWEMGARLELMTLHWR